MLNRGWLVTIALVITLLGISIVFTLKPKPDFPLVSTQFVEKNGLFEAKITNIKIGGLKRKEVGVLFTPSIKWESKYFSNPFKGQANIYDSTELIYSQDLSQTGYALLQEIDGIPSIVLKEFLSSSSGSNKDIKIVIRDFKINGEKPQASSMQFYYSNSRIK